MTERTTVRLPEELLRRARRKAAKEGRTVTSLIEEGLRRVVVESRKPESVSRKMPRVSEATGGLLSGIDLTRNSVLQEFEDLAYSEKLKP